MAAVDASEAPPRRDDAEMDAAVAGPATTERGHRDGDAGTHREEDTPDALFAMLTPAFLEHKSRASLDAEEAHGLARMLAEVSDEGIAETQVDGALALARNVIRAVLRLERERDAEASSSDDATTTTSRPRTRAPPEPSPQNPLAVTSYVPSTAASAHEVARAAAVSHHDVRRAVSGLAVAPRGIWLIGSRRPGARDDWDRDLR